MKKRFFGKKVLLLLLAFLVTAVPMGTSCQVCAQELTAGTYYKTWEEAYEALKAKCGIADASKYTEVQADLIMIFLEEWSDKVYAVNSKSEADTILANALDAYKKLKINDSAAMAEHAKVMKAREEAVSACRSVFNANLSDSSYSRVSRQAYDSQAREILRVFYKAVSYAEIEKLVSDFEACESILVKLPKEVLDAKSEAKLRIREIIKDEFESCFNEANHDDEIDDCDSLEEIEQTIENARQSMIDSINRDIKSYRNKKDTKIYNLLKSYETELSEADYKDLKAYYSEEKIYVMLDEATTKAEVDALYAQVISKIREKAEELKNTPDVEEKPDNVLESVAFHKEEVTIGVGQMAFLKVILTPEKAEYSTCRLSTSDQSIVRVDPSFNSGKIFAEATGVSPGTAVLKFEIEDKIAMCTVTVTEELQEIKAETITIDNALDLKVGDEVLLSRNIFPVNVTDSTIIWEIKDPEIVSVSANGKVKALKAGETTVTAKCGEAVSEPCTIVVREVFKPGVNRIFGETRYETSLKIADAYKEQLGVEKFRTVVVADGRNFPDALAGSYFAIKNNAPILMVNEKNLDNVKSYIHKNVTRGGSVYILGGTGAVPASFEENFYGYYVERISGKNRYETNLAILKAAGIEDEPILICTGTGFADSLSASATGYPILLVGKNGLTASQRRFLHDYQENLYYIIGGTGAVSQEVEKELLDDDRTVKRVSGKTRYETSVKIAEEFFESPDTAVFAYAMNFPDGLCGGPLAAGLKAPLILTKTDKQTSAAGYVQSQMLGKGIVLGGKSLISDDTMKDIYGKENDITITIK